MLVLILFIGNPSFLSIYNLKTIANATAILLAVGLGQSLVILTGGVDLSVGGIISLISVIHILSLVKFGLFGFLITLFMAGVMGLLNGFIFTKLRIPSFVATLGTGGIYTSLTFLLSRAPLAAPAATYKLLDVVNGSILGFKNSWIIALVVFIGYLIIQKYTYLGRTIMPSAVMKKCPGCQGSILTGPSFWLLFFPA